MSLKIHVTLTDAAAEDVTAYYNALVAGIKGGQMPEVEIVVHRAVQSRMAHPDPLRQNLTDLAGGRFPAGTAYGTQT